MKSTGTAAVFISLASDSKIPFYKQIYDAYRTAILAGKLRPGKRLPSTRALAEELRISRLPVVNAFEQLLHEGYVEGKIGAGTFVTESLPDDYVKPEIPERVRPRPRPHRHAASSTPYDQGLGPFRVSLPALDHFPDRIWSRLVARHAKNLSIEQMAYGHPAGYLPLRESIAEYLRSARGVLCEATQVLIVSGSQLALQVCARALLKTDDAICMEEPGYPGARDALGSTGARIVPVPLDEDGILIDELLRCGRKAKAVYVTPSHQYPLGVSMPASRRLELIDWAQRNRAWIIEDDYDSEYRYTSRPIGALQGMDNESRVIYIGTFSKVLFPSLRVGYVVVPHELFSEFISLREAIDIFSPTLYQIVLTSFLQEGHFGRHLRKMRSLYLSRRNAMIENLEEHAGKILKPYNIDAGLHLSAFLPSGCDDVALVRTAARQNIYATPLSSCYAGKQAKQGLILGFGGADEHQISVAAKKLGSILRQEVKK